MASFDFQPKKIANEITVFSHLPMKRKAIDRAVRRYQPKKENNAKLQIFTCKKKKKIGKTFFKDVIQSFNSVLRRLEN